MKKATFLTLTLVPIGLLLIGCANVKRVSNSQFVEEIRQLPVRPLFISKPDPRDSDKSIRFYGIKFEQTF